MTYVLTLYVFVQAMGGMVGFVSKMPFETMAACSDAGDREMANMLNPATHYECKQIGQPA